MSLQLDTRQRAMLAEMGIRVFLPDAGNEPVAAVPAAGAAAAAPAAVLAPPVVRPVPAPAAPHVREPAPQPASAGTTTVTMEGLDWQAFASTVHEWAAGQGRKAVIGIGDLQPVWLCVGDPPDEEEERQGLPFAGERGQLLDNMLRAVGASRSQGAYLTNCWKSRPPEGRSASEAQVAQQEAFLRRQVQLLQPRMILAMGRIAVQAVLQSGEPPGRLRGRLHRYLDVPVVVTYPPISLLRTPGDKAKAWADLCLAQAALREAT